MWKIRHKKYNILGIVLALVMGSGLLCNEPHKLQSSSTNCNSVLEIGSCRMKQGSGHQFHPEAPGLHMNPSCNMGCYIEKLQVHTLLVAPTQASGNAAEASHLQPKQVPFHHTAIILVFLHKKDRYIYYTFPFCSCLVFSENNFTYKSPHVIQWDLRTTGMVQTQQ